MLSRELVTGHVWLLALETWEILIELSYKCEIHTGLQKLSVKT